MYFGLLLLFGGGVFLGVCFSVDFDWGLGGVAWVAVVLLFGGCLDGAGALRCTVSFFMIGTATGFEPGVASVVVVTPVDSFEVSGASPKIVFTQSMLLLNPLAGFFQANSGEAII